MNPELSVIVPFHGDPGDLAGCLEGLKNQRVDFQFEVIVAESGSGPEAAALVAGIPGAVVVSSPSLMFPGKARNAGVSRSRSDLLAFIDADCVPSPDWLAAVRTSLNDGCDVVCGPVLDLHPFHPVASVDNLLQFPDFQKHRPSENLSHFPSCNFAIPKKTFLAAGGFPEDIPVGEDVLFGEAVIAKSREPIRFYPAMAVRHRGRRSFSRFLEHHETFGYYRALYNLRISVKNDAGRARYRYALYLGLRRLGYLIVRSVQWNPVGLVRIAVFFPLVLAGLISWVRGFHSGAQKSPGGGDEN